MGGKPKSKSTSTSGSAQAWAQPLASAAANDISDVYHANQPALQELTNTTRSNVVNPLIGKFQSSLGPAGQATGYYSDVLGGKYMGGNPYLQNVIDSSARDVRNNVASVFEQSGRYGSGAHQDLLERNIGDMSSGLRYQNYGDEMNRMGQAAEGAQRGSASDVATLMSALGLTAEMPYVGSNNRANSLGALFSGGTSTATQTGPSPIWGALGAGLGAAGAIWGK